MSELHCAQSDECRSLCVALAFQGVEIPPDASECPVPNSFKSDNEGYHLDLPGEVRNAALVGKLAGVLYNTLESSPRANQNIARHIGRHEDVLTAQTNLWGAMVESAQAGRPFTATEKVYYATEIAQAVNNRADDNVLTSAEVVAARAAFDSQTLRTHGLVFDDQAVNVLNRLASNYLDSKPSLLVGDKGIAKSQLARYMADLASHDKQPVFISGHGDQMGDEFIGRYVQDEETGRFVFKEGKLIAAAREGVPVIIDEINLADQSITMRLQDILLRKPGDVITLPEDGGREVIISPGFTVIATANEASERYRHRVILDPAFRDRFEVINLEYPDSDNQKPLLEIPGATMRLALAAVTDTNGNLSRHVSLPELESFARLCHVTQRLYSTPLEDSGVKLKQKQETTSFLIADKPAMSDCITPRTMVDTLRRLAAGNKPGMNLQSETDHLIKSLDQTGTVNADYAKQIMELFKGNN